MSQYNALGTWLQKQRGDRVSVTFEDIEDQDKIGVKLPPTAREHRQWWANERSPDSRHVQCRAWSEAGWKVEEVDLAAETVVFARLLGPTALP
jgi:hypothetical protein